MENKQHSTLWYILNGFLLPFGLGENPFHVKPMTPREAIADAWRTVGDNMRIAMQQYEQETGIHIDHSTPTSQSTPKQNNQHKHKQKKHHGRIR